MSNYIGYHDLTVDDLKAALVAWVGDETIASNHLAQVVLDGIRERQGASAVHLATKLQKVFDEHVERYDPIEEVPAEPRRYSFTVSGLVAPTEPLFRPDQLTLTSDFAAELERRGQVVLGIENGKLVLGSLDEGDGEGDE